MDAMMKWGGDFLNQNWATAPVKYDRTNYPPQFDISNKIKSGQIQLREGDVLEGWNFSMPENQEIFIPPGVTLINCTVSSGRVIFSNGNCDVIAPEGVAMANGPDAVATSKVAGGYVFSLVADATAIARVPGSFAHGMAPGSIVYKFHPDAHATTYEQLRATEEYLKKKVEEDGDLDAACKFAALNLSGFYQSPYSREMATNYLQFASDNGSAAASNLIGNIFNKGNSSVTLYGDWAKLFFNRANGTTNQVDISRLNEIAAGVFDAVNLAGLADLPRDLKTS